MWGRIYCFVFSPPLTLLWHECGLNCKTVQQVQKAKSKQLGEQVHSSDIAGKRGPCEPDNTRESFLSIFLPFSLCLFKCLFIYLSSSWSYLMQICLAVMMVVRVQASRRSHRENPALWPRELKTALESRRVEGNSRKETETKISNAVYELTKFLVSLLSGTWM